MRKVTKEHKARANRWNMGTQIGTEGGLWKEKTMNELKRITEFEPAFDKRHPDPKQNYGIHGVTLRMVLKGDKGAVQFVVYTNWQLPHVTQEAIERMKEICAEVAVVIEPEEDIASELRCFWTPMAADLGYHSRVPMYEGQPAMGAIKTDIKMDDTKEGIEKFNITTTETMKYTPCEYLDGEPCYYDGSSLNAVDVMKILIEQGSEAVWKYLEECYHEQFDK